MMNPTPSSADTQQKTEQAIIIGAGPAGLTAAFELLTRSNIKPIIIELDPEYVGGISRTVRYKGNRIDIGGHRFFSKSERVMSWWLAQLPLDPSAPPEAKITYQKKQTTISREEHAPTEKHSDDIMLIRPRKSRIVYLRKFFEYPLKLSLDTLKNLGIIRVCRIGVSYTLARIHPVKPEKTLEDFFINRFGRELYLTFFKSYTEKVWGVPCNQIDAEWGAQRIKGLSITKAVLHAMRSLLGGAKDKEVETSLIEQFLYPKLGPGQLWEHVAGEITRRGGEIRMGETVVGLTFEKGKITSIRVKKMQTNEEYTLQGNYFFSTMPISELIGAMEGPVPNEVREIASQLAYRDFVTVGVLLKKITSPVARDSKPIDDTWVYVQEPDVLVGRIQFFNNWSPALVKEPGQQWIGMEYFTNVGDTFWQMEDAAIAKLAVEELTKIRFADSTDVLDTTVIRVKKTYPSYTGAYKHFDVIRSFVDAIPNLFLIGRNGMHRYNNQDHSMLTAMVAVDMILAHDINKHQLWNINTEKEYHEEKKSS